MGMQQQPSVAHAPRPSPLSHTATFLRFVRLPPHIAERPFSPAVMGKVDYLSVSWDSGLDFRPGNWKRDWDSTPLRIFLLILFIPDAVRWSGVEWSGAEWSEGEVFDLGERVSTSDLDPDPCSFTYLTFLDLTKLMDGRTHFIVLRVLHWVFIQIGNWRLEIEIGS